MGHGHDDHGHATAPHGAQADHGPVDFPPIPDPRAISPAREDFDLPWPGKLLLWPFLWTGVALLLLVVARSWGQPVGAHEHGHDAAPTHGAPREAPAGEPASMGEEPSSAGEHGR